LSLFVSECTQKLEEILSTIITIYLNHSTVTSSTPYWWSVVRRRWHGIVSHTPVIVVVAAHRGNAKIIDEMHIVL